MRATRAEVDLGAVRHNIEVLRAAAAPAEVCAVVKADGYGHGAIAVGQVAVDAGVAWLAVALVEEGAVLRRSGIDVPVLLLSPPPAGDAAAALRWGLRLTTCTSLDIDAAAAAAVETGTTARLHLKVDTGMQRIGADHDDVVSLARQIEQTPGVELEAVWTHCAVADEPGNPFTDVQLDRFEAVIEDLEAAGLRPPMVHAANSAAAIDHPRARHDLVRIGIAAYGIAPSPALSDRLPLRPAMSLRSEVSHVKEVEAGTGISYGLRHTFDEATVVATVPIGYADGVPRALSASGGEVLVGGRRCPMVGVVTMDQLMVDCGPGAQVAVGDDVVLLGEQGGEAITADDWAAATGTIPYEVVCGIGPRVPRVYPG